MTEPIASDNISTCFCPETNHTGGKCWPGTYCPSGITYPVSCDLGMYCQQFGLESPNGPCNAGYYCDGNATQPDPSHRVCPPGHYCELGSGSPTPCPAGTMSDVSGATNITSCIACTAGYYCEGTANTDVTGPCAPGYYCPAGQESGTPANYNCTEGHYCPGKTGDPVPCPSGSYQDEILQSQCKDCPSGRWVKGTRCQYFGQLDKICKLLNEVNSTHQSRIYPAKSI